MTRISTDPALHRLVRSVLPQYDLHQVRVRLVSAKEHAVFHVDATTPAGVPERFALRLYHHATSVQTDVEWLGALRNEAGLLVPEPVAARHGAYILYTSSGAPGMTCASVLFRWVRGRQRAASLSPTHWNTLAHSRHDYIAVHSDFTHPSVRWRNTGTGSGSLAGARSSG